MRAITSILFLFLVYANLAFAMNPNSPKQIVANLYHPYLQYHNKSENNLPQNDALDLISMYASPSLNAAIQREQECRIREGELCKIDFDIIINGQDNNLQNLSLHENKTNGTASVTAKFTNGCKHEVTYFFIRNNSKWQLDDVEAFSYANRHSYRLKQILNNH